MHWLKMCFVQFWQRTSSCQKKLRGSRIDVRGVTIGLAILTAFILTGCLADRWVGVEPGQYVVVDRTGTANAIASAEIQTLEIDRDKNRATFILVDGLERVVRFAPRDRAAWPSGCPTNINSTRMEVLDLEEKLLTLGSLTLSQPILVRNCPPNPIQVVLRDALEVGAIGGGGAACAQVDRCVFFEPQPVSALLTTPLPSSMKGYELYSWYVEQDSEWYYTLITATNRLKTYEEITSAEDKVIEEGWVKITVKGTDSLKELLGRLPESETVVWIDGTWPEHVPGEGRNFAFPERRIVDEIERHCRQLGLELNLTGQIG